MIGMRPGLKKPLEYDVYEVLPNGATAHRAFVTGLEAAWKSLYDLAATTKNECFALYSPTRQVVAQVNVPPAWQRARKLIFQIAYTEELGIIRTEELTRRGYRVTTVVGNERAKVVLKTLLQPYDLFVLGHGAPDITRKEMVSWLRENHPTVKILSLNAQYQRLPEADYNAPLNEPERWVHIISQAVM